MPRRDGTGPQGIGPMTGKKAGKCGTNTKSSNSISNKSNNLTGRISGFFNNNSKNSNKQTGFGKNRRGK